MACFTMTHFFRKFRLVLEMIAFSHAIFALPFALSSFIISHKFNNLDYTIKEFLYLITALLSARNVAMAFNRWLDRDIDALNPRTKDRHIPKKMINSQFVIAFIFINTFIFIIISSFFNYLTLILSPFALLIICFYSFTKRFTHYSHFALGLSLAIAPVGAWIAVSGTLHPLPFLLGAGVLFWVAGFDILYALQDLDFDRKQGLHSIPARFGPERALFLSRLCHVLACGAWLLLGLVYHFGVFYFLILGTIALILRWEQRLLSPTDLSRLNRAFFTLNGYVGILFFFSILLAL